MRYYMKGQITADQGEARKLQKEVAFEPDHKRQVGFQK